MGGQEKSRVLREMQCSGRGEKWDQVIETHQRAGEIEKIRRSKREMRERGEVGRR